ncbi:glycosyltransferase family 87 protein [Alisedimentitalea sp. MJ-SS2]|uniref:glycosyltransferase family 87 protein n=1 Tax=Aliisedimentitalea sp. MJ-SS2 TaxID=3049795 RepID=UPI0029066241|nr:glycosyltransferase family 87 protein [Alisedimentitalea sp. MJ-SS2]MDU8928268.1 glycosyltransferase family 87 protein [Alisedimentitalea sp. MJ-SS2]
MWIPYLTPARIRSHSKVLVFAYALGGLIGYLRPFFFKNSDLAYPTADFVCFYAAGRLAALGRAKDAYDIFKIHEVYSSVLPNQISGGGLGWYYPPTFFLPLDPLSGLEYFPALLSWVLVTALLFAIALRPLLNSRTEAWVIAASAPVVFNAFAGQNGLLTASLIVLLYRFLPSNPALAGMALGLMSYKPHFGILFIVLAMAMGKWRVIFNATITTAVLILASIYFHGLEPWRAFFTENLKNLSALHSQVGSFSMPQISSVYYFSLSLGFSVSAAKALQIAFIILCAVSIVFLAKKGAKYNLVFACTVTAALPAAPHNFPYDWAILTLPCLILWQEIEKTGERAFERLTILVLMFGIIPLFILPQNWQFSPGAVLPLTLLVLLVRRTRQNLNSAWATADSIGAKSPFS